MADGNQNAEVLELEQTMWDELVEAAWADFPFEVCGFLGLHADGTATHFPIRNAERSMTYYLMDAKQMLRAIRTIEDDGLGLVIYHSHTHTRAYPSATDIRHAAYPEATYLIITLQDHDKPAMRAFDIVDGKVTEKSVVVRDAQPA